jgi:hypothetical protein
VGGQSGGSAAPVRAAWTAASMASAEASAPFSSSSRAGVRGVGGPVAVVRGQRGHPVLGDGPARVGVMTRGGQNDEWRSRSPASRSRRTVHASFRFAGQAAYGTRAHRAERPRTAANGGQNGGQSTAVFEQGPRPRRESGAAPSDWPVCSASLRGRGAWKHTRQHPLGAGVVTLGHLLVAAIAMWCVAHFHRIARVADLFGS